MLFTFGVEKGDSVTIPVDWANIICFLPNGRPVPGVVQNVNGPITTIATDFGDVKIATVTVLGWYK